MKKILFIVLLCVVSAGAAFGQKKRVAITEIVDAQGNVDNGLKLAVRSSIITGINHIDGYEAYERVNISAMFKELDFQRSGYMKDEQIHKIGEMTEASYILISELSRLFGDNNYILTARIIDIETGLITESAESYIDKNPESVKNVGRELTMKLLGVYGGGGVPVRQGGSANYGGGLPRAKYKETGCGLQMSMVYVQGGEFMMGGTSEQGSEAEDNEFPVRKVTVGDFYIGQYEVTQGEWAAVMGTSISQQRDKVDPSWPLYGVGSDYPMYYVSWEEASEFCRILSRRTGRTYRLPTEAEWEYAARGGRRSDGCKYSGGNMMDYVGWYEGNSGNADKMKGAIAKNTREDVMAEIIESTINIYDRIMKEYDDSGSTAHSVGAKTSNELDIYDMSGNVWEWCRDWYGEYDGSDVNNPSGPSSGSNRVLRGGNWNDVARNCRVPNRNYGSPGKRYYYSGFRVVCLP